MNQNMKLFLHTWIASLLIIVHLFGTVLTRNSLFFSVQNAYLYVTISLRLLLLARKKIFFMFCWSAIVEKLHEPLQGKIEEWKKVATQLDKDHNRGWFMIGLFIYSFMYVFIYYNLVHEVQSTINIWTKNIIHTVSRLILKYTLFFSFYFVIFSWYTEK